MDNYLLMKENKEVEQLSRELGFSRTLFIDRDFVLVKESSKNKLLNKIKEAKKKVLFIPSSEELLRFALEKTAVNFILGTEKINPKDSVHFLRGGLDQITCKIAAAKDKTICFSLSDVMQEKNPARLLARMGANLRLCKKFGVKVLVGNFSVSEAEIRSAKDLLAFSRVLAKKKKLA